METDMVLLKGIVIGLIFGFAFAVAMHEIALRRVLNRPLSHSDKRQ